VPPARGGISVRAEALDVPRPAGAGLGVREASLSVAAGEIVGVAAVEGNGQRELLRAVARLIAPLRGTLHVAEPIAFIAEDRTTEGLIPELSLTQNLVLTVGDPAPWRHGAWIDWRRARTEAAVDIRRYRISAPGPELPAGSLSGGNQQKLAVAGALRRHPKVIVAENPTRGLDIQATAFVHDRLREAAVNGAAVLVYSSDLDEVLELAQRVVVMCRGVLTEAPANSGRAQIGQMMLGLRIGD
jgi:simple sugar transport system ATP-binding protein